MSDDGRHALSLIAMLGSVFSPYYASARRRLGAAADPLDHVALNVAVYGPRASAWALTERRSSAVERWADELCLGPSRLRLAEDALVIDIDERTAPLPGRVTGRVRIEPRAIAGETLPLDARGAHRWTAIAPRARAEVVLTSPSVRFRGEAYLDANDGDEGLEDAFRGWSWARAGSRARTTITYDVERRDGSRLTLARSFTDRGEERGFDIATTSGPSTRWWRMPRRLASEHGALPVVSRTLEDTPFYARSLVETRFFGERHVGTHEALSLDRFRSPVVERMLAYRMRREVG